MLRAVGDFFSIGQPISLAKDIVGCDDAKATVVILIERSPANVTYAAFETVHAAKQSWNCGGWSRVMYRVNPDGSVDVNNPILDNGRWAITTLENAARQLDLKKDERRQALERQREEAREREEAEVARKAKQEEDRRRQEAAKKAKDEEDRRRQEAAKQAKEEEDRRRQEAAKKAKEEEDRRRRDAATKAKDEEDRRRQEAAKQAKEEEDPSTPPSAKAVPSVAPSAGYPSDGHLAKAKPGGPVPPTAPSAVAPAVAPVAKATDPAPPASPPTASTAREGEPAEVNNRPPGCIDLSKTELLGFEEAVERSGLTVQQQDVTNAWKASGNLLAEMRKKYNKDLTRDEIAAIYLYTTPGTFYMDLNAILRSTGRQSRLEDLKPFLKLMLNAKRKLPEVRKKLYRGLREWEDKETGKMTIGGYDFKAFEDFYMEKEREKETATVSWWAFSSCSTKPSVLNDKELMGFKGERVMFHILGAVGVDISEMSAVQSENEVLLFPGATFRVEEAYRQPGVEKNPPFIVHLTWDTDGEYLFC